MDSRCCTECNKRLTLYLYTTYLHDKNNISFNIHIHISCLKRAQIQGQYLNFTV